MLAFERKGYLKLAASPPQQSRQGLGIGPAAHRFRAVHHEKTQYSAEVSAYYRICVLTHISPELHPNTLRFRHPIYQRLRQNQHTQLDGTIVETDKYSARMLNLTPAVDRPPLYNCEAVQYAGTSSRDGNI